MIKSTHDKSIPNTILNEEKLKLLTLKSGTRRQSPLSPLLLVSVVLEVLVILTIPGKKRVTKRKKRGHIIPIYRWHDTTLKRP